MREGFLADGCSFLKSMDSGVVNNSPLTLQELDMIMSEITGHIVPSLPELRETKV